MSLRGEKRIVAIILAASLILFCIYSITTPLFEASDELWHYPLVLYLASTASLPVQHAGQTDSDAPWRQEGSQPPLYYAVTALVVAPFDSSNWREIRRQNPHSDLGHPTRDGNANAILHTPAEQFPWTRAALAAHVARLVSVTFSTLTVLCAYLVACELFPRYTPRALIASGDMQVPPSQQTDQRAWLRIGTMLFTAFLPMFAFISGSINNDNAAAMFSTLGLWWGLRLARTANLSLRSAMIAGCITSAAALSKSSTLGLIGVYALAAALAAWSQRAKPMPPHTARLILQPLRFMLVIVAVVALLAGWWFIRNQQLYGDVLGWNAFLDIAGRRVPPATLAQLWSERQGFVWAYWGVFGTLNVIMPPIVYDILNGMVALAIGGITWKALRGMVVRLRRLPTTAPAISAPGLLTRAANIILCGAWLAVTFIAFLRWTSLTDASQGRLLFPCIAIFAACLAFGLYQIHRVALWAAASGMVLLSIAAPFAFVVPAYAQPPAMSTVMPSQRLDVTFSGGLELIGYDIPQTSLHPGDEATLRLYWRVQSPLPTNYSIFVHLLNAEDVIIGQRDMYPGQGSLATTELKAGFAWSDHYAVPVSQLTLAPQPLHWAVGVYELQTGQRLTITHGAATEQGIEFGQLLLAPDVQPNPVLLDYGNGILLTAYDVQPRVAVAGQPLTVTLQWRASDRIGNDYVVSLQLLDDKANKIAQNDSAPASGSAPTSSWTRGAEVTDLHRLQISPNANPGVYRLLLVVYQPKDFSHLGAYTAQGQYINTEIELMRLRVK